MQVGFVMLEAGFARSRESINILVEGIVDTCILRRHLLGVGLCLHVHGRDPVDRDPRLLPQRHSRHLSDDRRAAARLLGVPVRVRDTCSTITSGAMVGRCGFWGDILYSIGVTGFIYPIIGHWAWGPDGWLAVMGTPFRDFAGSTVVHTIGGAISPCGREFALGPRLGRVFARDGGGPMLPHNIIPRRGWRPHPLVRLVRLQPGQHPLRDGPPGHCPRVVQHHDGRAAPPA
jgi:Amt family ammonium transporter